METTHRTTVLTHPSTQLAVLVSLCAITVGIALSAFLQVPESVIVIATIIVASIIGFRQPARPAEPEFAELQLVG
jgi:Na+/H+ antiporter NhaC